MGRYLVRRFLLLLPSLVVPLVLVFTLLQLAPGDPVTVMLGDNPPPEQVAALRAELGLDQPLPVQFGRWLVQLATFDLGRSIFIGEPVLDVILDRAPVTLQLTAMALAIAIVLGVVAGIASSLYRNTITDRSVMFGAIVGVSMPEFWFGLNLILVFGVTLRWFPIGGYVPLSDSIALSFTSLALPALTLGFIQAAFIARITRSSMLDVVSEPHVATARAKGMPEWLVIVKHIFRAALLPVLTVIGITCAVLLGGAIAIETVFTLPGLGRLMINAVARRDYPLIQGLVLVISLANIVVNLAVDVVYALVDPRVRYE